MSRMMAAREKRSDGVELSDWWDFQVLRSVGFVEDDVVGVIEEPEEPDDEEYAEARDGVESIFLGCLTHKGRRCCFVTLGSLGPEEAVDEEDDEKANEKRDGEPGRPIRITVPFEADDAADSGRGISGDVGESSLRGERVFSGFILRPVRPPEGRVVRLGVEVGCTVADVRTQRSGAE
jgi:hypothetical protein